MTTPHIDDPETAALVERCRAALRKLGEHISIEDEWDREAHRSMIHVAVECGEDGQFFWFPSVAFACRKLGINLSKNEVAKMRRRLERHGDFCLLFDDGRELNFLRIPRRLSKGLGYAFERHKGLVEG